MTKYILNKKIKRDKANNINDFKDIGKAAWGFISSLYELRWDKLIANNNNHSIKYKVRAQFTPILNIEGNNKTNKSANGNKPVFFSLLPPLIPAKSPKEITKISKFFKKNTDNKEKKSYV